MKKLVISVLLILITGGAVWFLSDVPEFTPTETGAFRPTENPAYNTEPPSENVVHREPSANFRFFYNQLNADEQEIYRTLRDGLMNTEPSIQVMSDDLDVVADIFERIFWDYPEIFWATGAAQTQLVTRLIGQSYINFMPTYTHLGDEKNAIQVIIDARVEAFLATVDHGLSDFEVVLAVYEYIISTTAYNLDAPHHQNIISVFVHGESVCAGLSKAAQLLLNQLGIFATYVVGDAFIYGHDGPLPHAWNLVNVDGNYYHLDVTWGIPSFSEDSDITDRITILYDYFLVNDSMVAATHHLRHGVVIPPATSIRNNFFVVNNMFHDTVDETVLLNALTASIDANQPSATLKFANQDLFQIAQPLLLEQLIFTAAEPRARELGLQRIHFRFRAKENLNMMTIYWVWEFGN